MSKSTLTRMEPYGRVQRYGIPGFSHLIVEAQYDDEGTGKTQLEDWLVIDTRFDQAFDKWARWFVWRSPDLAGIRNWVQAGGPSLWDPELRRADKDWWPIPDGMTLGESGANSRRPSGSSGIRALANYCAGMMIFAAADAGFGGVPEDLINELGLTVEDVQRIDDEVDIIRRRLLSRGYKGPGREPEGGSARGEVPRRTDPGVGAERRLGRGGGGEVRGGGRSEDRDGDLQAGRPAHPGFRPGDVAGKKYAVCPGHVRSENDGQRHFIGFDELARLYGVKPEECLLVPPEADGIRLPDFVEGLVWLRPQTYARHYQDMREELARGEEAFKLDEPPQ